ISYSDKGFQAGDQSPPSQQPPAAFLDALKSAGITIELLPAANTDTSIESAGLRITQVQQMGPATQKVSFIIGHVSARIDGEAAPAGPPGQPRRLHRAGPARRRRDRSLRRPRRRRRPHGPGRLPPPRARPPAPGPGLLGSQVALSPSDNTATRRHMTTSNRANP